jgi:hypothetical protein
LVLYLGKAYIHFSAVFFHYKLHILAYWRTFGTTVSLEIVPLPPHRIKMSKEAVAQVQLDNFESIFSLEGKIALVTGGSRGLGLHTASG